MKKYYFLAALLLLSAILNFFPITTSYDTEKISATVGFAIRAEQNPQPRDCAFMGMAYSSSSNGFPFTSFAKNGTCGGGNALYPIGVGLNIIIAANIVYFVHSVLNKRRKI